MGALPDNPLEGLSPLLLPSLPCNNEIKTTFFYSILLPIASVSYSDAICRSSIMLWEPGRKLRLAAPKSFIREILQQMLKIYPHPQPTPSNRCRRTLTQKYILTNNPPTGTRCRQLNTNSKKYIPTKPRPNTTYPQDCLTGCESLGNIFG